MKNQNSTPMNNLHPIFEEILQVHGVTPPTDINQQKQSIMPQPFFEMTIFEEKNIEEVGKIELPYPLMQGDFITLDYVTYKVLRRRIMYAPALPYFFTVIVEKIV